MAEFDITQVHCQTIRPASRVDPAGAPRGCLRWMYQSTLGIHCEQSSITASILNRLPSLSVSDTKSWLQSRHQHRPACADGALCPPRQMVKRSSLYEADTAFVIDGRLRVPASARSIARRKQAISFFGARHHGRVAAYMTSDAIPKPASPALDCTLFLRLPRSRALQPWESRRGLESISLILNIDGQHLFQSFHRFQSDTAAKSPFVIASSCHGCDKAPLR